MNVKYAVKTAVNILLMGSLFILLRDGQSWFVEASAMLLFWRVSLDFSADFDRIFPLQSPKKKEK